jgi:hypothetical protein
MQAEFSMTRDEMKGDFDRVVGKFTTMAAQFAEQQSKQLFAAVSEAAESSGNVVSGRGGLTQDAFLELMEKVQVDLDPKTREPKNAVFVMHPGMARRMIPEKEAWEQDPVFKQRVAALREKQWIAFCDRESRRSLVD